MHKKIFIFICPEQSQRLTKTSKVHNKPNQSSLHFGCCANNTISYYNKFGFSLLLLLLYESFACLPSCYRYRYRYLHRYGRTICLRQCLPFVDLDKIWNCRLYLSVAPATFVSVSVSVSVAESARIFCSTFLMKSCYLLCSLFIYTYINARTYICVAFYMGLLSVVVVYWLFIWPVPGIKC